MAESRQRKEDLRQRVQEMLADCRSGPLSLETPDLNSIPGLIDAMNNLGSGIEAPALMELKGRFDLNRYQDHIRSCLEAGSVTLQQIPALIEDPRRDLIWRFIGVIFLEHAGLVTIRQQGQTIWVMKCDDRKGQDLLRRTQEADGFKRPVGGAQAW
jgi:hypothetical protein